MRSTFKVSFRALAFTDLLVSVPGMASSSGLLCVCMLMSDQPCNWYYLCAEFCACYALSCWVAVYLFGFSSWVACSYLTPYLPCLIYALFMPSPSAPASPSNDPHLPLNAISHPSSTGLRPPQILWLQIRVLLFPVHLWPLFLCLQRLFVWYGEPPSWCLFGFSTTPRWGLESCVLSPFTWCGAPTSSRFCPQCFI